MPKHKRKGKSSFTVKSKKKFKSKRAKGIGTAKLIANILGEAYKPAVTNFWNLANSRAERNRKAKEDFYYRR